MKQLILNTVVTLTLLLASVSHAFAVPLSKNEIQNLFPGYILTFVSHDEMVITGKEREIIDRIIFLLEPIGGLGSSNTIITPASIDKLAQELAAIRNTTTHKQELQNELKQFYSFFTENPHTMKCNYTAPHGALINGLVECELQTKWVQNCRYTGRFAVWVNPRTKEGLGVTASSVFSGASPSYAFVHECAG